MPLIFSILNKRDDKKFTEITVPEIVLIKRSEIYYNGRVINNLILNSGELSSGICTHTRAPTCVYAYILIDAHII